MDEALLVFIQERFSVNVVSRWREADTYMKMLRLHELLLSCGVATMRANEDPDMADDIMDLSRLALCLAESYLPAKQYESPELAFV